MLRISWGFAALVPIGSSLPLWAGTSGRLLLACLPDDKREKLLAQLALQRFTEETITSVAALRRDLQRVRKQGYAVSYGERVGGAASISTPVRDGRGNVVAAFTISAPRERFLSQEELLLHLAREGAARLSAQIGYTSNSPQKTVLVTP